MFLQGSVRLLLLLCFAGTIHSSSLLLCTDGASAGSTFSFQDNFLATRSTSTISCMLFRQFVYLYFIGIDSHFKILDLCTFDSMLKTMGKSCTSSATSASPFLPGRYFFTWNARGNYSLSLEGIFSPLSNSTLQSETSGHEPCRASILLSYLHLLCFFGGLGSTLPYSTVSRV